MRQYWSNNGTAKNFTNRFYEITGRLVTAMTKPMLYISPIHSHCHTGFTVYNCARCAE